MKARLINILCLLIVIVSIAWIAKMVFFGDKKESLPEVVKDPLTEISIDTPTMDFGTVKADSLLVAKFVIHNTGQNPLLLYDVNPDCSCTSFYQSKKMVATGDTASVVLTLDTKGKVGTQLINTRLKVNTAQQLYLLKLKARIQ